MKTKQIDYLIDITKEDMTRIIERDKRNTMPDPNFTPDPKVREQLLKALVPFRREE